MTDTPTLWDQPSQARPLVDVPLSYRSSDPETSREAAEANAPRSDAQRMRVLKALARMGERGSTDTALASYLAMDRGTVARRRKDLEEMGLCERTEERRSTVGGATGLVFRINEAGRRAAQEAA